MFVSTIPIAVYPRHADLRAAVLGKQAGTGLDATARDSSTSKEL